ncbi:P-loop containing nucleoside triphosphate hydrolase protein [Fimicolochytrium jonesii]|uniref:P-loop containing nucleoside triphosphate hydrolase protein n=1 Tax=Fimicolochytrium jonesii TaxID=1396493 RepID=UPI0022FE8CA6|nr:P-loop containing nucleoside triphosphate hydrolase protein [Fimicolochytrium jonesii]KAI8817199.1 P-loop containing nucleoside triphosphate hydrolase protein [Fimicolochytrium jonesii]
MQILVGVLLGVHIAQFVLRRVEETFCEGEYYTCQATSFAIGTASLIFAAVLHHYEHLRSRSASAVLFFYWLFSGFAGVVQLRSFILSRLYQDDLVVFVLQCVFVAITLVQFILENVAKPGTYYSSLDEDAVSPEETANILSRLTFQWMWPLMKLGAQKDLTMDDLWHLRTVDTAVVTGGKFQANWQNELLRKKPSLLRAIIATYGAYFGSAAFFKAGQDALAFVQPIFLKKMMEFAASWSDRKTKDQSIEQGFIIAVMMLLTAITQTMVLHQYFHICLTSSMQIRSAIVAAVYRKSLSLSNISRQASTVGEIVNLQSVDAGRISDLCSYLHISWSGPFQIALAIYFLHQTLGPSIFAGVGIMILMIPVNALLATTSRDLNKVQMKNKDTRTKLMDELLNGIKVIKLYAWERPFLKKVFAAREAELHTLRKLGYLSAVQSFTWACTPFLVSFASFSVYTLVSEEPLTSSKVFVCISLFNLLQFPLSVFPSVITAMIEASVSFNRLYNFLRNEELDKNAVIREPAHFQPLTPDAPRIDIRNGTFRWTQDGANTLDHINMQVRDGELFAIVGSVGAGKSSIISALLGEMYKSAGEVHLRGSVAYVPQNAWIMNATLKENILFGLPYDEEYYKKVVAACGLTSDLEMLPGGDSVEIGERGINLSGGQKQRVSVARAVYSRADVYLFDDPLSAVDAHVGRHIFENVLGPKGVLKNKARVLVTHGIHFLPETDTVMLVQDGTVAESGSYQSLMDHEGSLFNLIRDFGQAKHNGSDEENDDVEAEGLAQQSAGQSRRPSHASLSRRSSKGSIKASVSEAVNKDAVVANNALILKEATAAGSVSWDVYTTYAKACGKPIVVIYLIIAIASQCLSVAQNVYLADWANDNDRQTHGANEGDRRAILKRLAIYGTLGVSYSVTIIGQVIFAWVACGIRSARILHTDMLESVIRFPQSFFDTTPLGRVINRFSKDQYTVDEVLPRTFQGYFRTLFAVLSVVAVNVLGSPLFIIFVVPLGFLYAYFQRFYLSTSRELKRLDSTSRSPIYAHFSETLGGVSTIRAYQQEGRFITVNENKIDTNMRAYYPSISSNRWLAVRLELIGSLIVFGSAFFSVATIAIKGHIPASIVGLMITYSLNVTQSLNWMVRQSCEIETNIVAVERIKEYIDLPREAPYEIPSETPPREWPQVGRIDFINYSTRYRTGLELVLKDISFSVKGREKIGIVGRTGAGKSSLTLSLFRLIERVSGKIVVDDVDIANLGLFDLRSRLSIIPQDPVLFSGTIRDNLDPFGVYDDQAIWRALEDSSLKAHVTRMEKGLASVVLQGGENFSVGQRQLICLARALLRKTNILVLDEATAAVDVETDTIIQKTIREEFKDCTILTIAHRINTVMDSDRILLLDRGRIAEFDSPANLLRDKKSMFYSLAKEAGQVA